MKEKYGIELSEIEVNQFLSDILDIERQEVSLQYINAIILKVAEVIPFQNIEMTTKYFNNPLNGDDLKQNIFNGKGGICTTINPFMASVLNIIGFNVHLIACGLKGQDKRHVAICLHIGGINYFLDFGDAQPYFEAIELNDLAKEYHRSFRSFKISISGGDNYIIELKRENIWTPYFEFNLEPVNFSYFDQANRKFYSDIDYGPFWKQIHFGLYVDKKLRAIRGNTFIIETGQGKFTETRVKNETQFRALLIQYFPEQYKRFDFILARNKIYELNSVKRFGFFIDDNEFNDFLTLINLSEYEVTFEYLRNFIRNVTQKIPFQNINMLIRGKGKSPSVEEIKEDMLSGLGGPCGTMNPFIGSILFKMGFDVYLVAGTMENPNDHVALILNWENDKFYVDCGDGQPYFTPISTKNEAQYFHPFKTFRLKIIDHTHFEIHFLVKNEWVKDVTVNLTQRDFSFFENSIYRHYTDVNYGPFWEGIRFSCYPDSKIVAIRNNCFIFQDNDENISKHIFEDFNTFKMFIKERFKSYNHKFEEAFLKIH